MKVKGRKAKGHAIETEHRQVGVVEPMPPREACKATMLTRMMKVNLKTSRENHKARLGMLASAK